MKRNRKSVPAHSSLEYVVGRRLYSAGPRARDDALFNPDFGSTPVQRNDGLNRAISSGWFAELSGGLIGVSIRAQLHYTEVELASKSKADSDGAKDNVGDSKPLSAKYFLNTRGPPR